jgi:hypothetical protein
VGTPFALAISFHPEGEASEEGFQARSYITHMIRESEQVVVRDSKAKLKNSQLRNCSTLCARDLNGIIRVCIFTHLS